MKIKSIEYLHKKLRFKKKVFLDGTDCSHRDIHIIKVKTDAGITGIGEAVLLQSHGTESFQEFLQVQKSLNKFVDSELSDEFLNNTFLFDQLEKTPALKSAFEQTIFNVFIQTKNPIKDILNQTLKPSIKINAVIPHFSEDEIINSIQEKFSKGFKVFKIKVGRQDLTTDFKLIEKISTLFPEIKLRIDPNCRWAFQELCEHINHLEKFNIDYIEQPVLQTEKLFELQSISKIPIAADESAFDFNSVKSLIDQNIKTIILKPLPAGGITNSLKIIDYAKLNNARVLISSSFESNIGLQIPIILASILNSDDYHGLDTSDFFTDNTISPLWKTEADKIILPNQFLIDYD